MPRRPIGLSPTDMNFNSSGSGGFDIPIPAPFPKHLLKAVAKTGAIDIRPGNISGYQNYSPASLEAIRICTGGSPAVKHATLKHLKFAPTRQWK